MSEDDRFLKMNKIQPCKIKMPPPSPLRPPSPPMLDPESAPFVEMMSEMVESIADQESRQMLEAIELKRRQDGMFDEYVDADVAMLQSCDMRVTAQKWCERAGEEHRAMREWRAVAVTAIVALTGLVEWIIVANIAVGGER